MVRRKVYRSKRAAGRRTRFPLWIEIGGRGTGTRRRSSGGAGWGKTWTRITTWLSAVGGTAKRKTTTRRRGGTSDVHPNLYRRRAQPRPTAGVDEVARMRRRRRNRGSR